jgi:hypothetical protein
MNLLWALAVILLVIWVLGYDAFHVTGSLIVAKRFERSLLAAAADSGTACSCGLVPLASKDKRVRASQ